jgi:superoxide reductase
MISSEIQSADWKTEKHAPVIELEDSIEAGKETRITASIGKEIAHPNTTEHYIAWIKILYTPDGGKFPIQLGDFQFTAHGESAKGANQGPAFTEPFVTVSVKLAQSGTIHAMSYCNIHGLWQSEAKIKVS